MSFYVLLGKTKAGPYPVEDLKARGYWNPDDLVCKEGEGEWKRVGDLREEDLAEPPVEEVVHRPDPPERRTDDRAWRCSTLVFPLYIAAILFEKKAEYYYREGNYELAEKYDDYARSCLLVAAGMVCVGFLLVVFLAKTKGV